MSTDQRTIAESTIPAAIPFPGVGVRPHAVLNIGNTESQPSLNTQSDDPRWVFAMRVRLAVESGPITTDLLDNLHQVANRLGMSPMQGQAIIGCVERAHARGGFDRIAHNEIMQIPAANGNGIHALSSRARWITFGVLFAWALSIAGLMQIVV
jgi:hypothetical protein